MKDLFFVVFISVVASLSASLLSEMGHKQKLYDLHIKCVEMKEIPLGFCSKIFKQN